MGFRRRIIIMYRTRQQFPSFMGVYIPPCGNIHSGVNIRVRYIATVRTMEVFSISNSYMFALVTRLRCIRWGNGYYFNPFPFTFIFKERAKLVEAPRVTPSPECFIPLFGVHTQSDIFQILDCYTFMFFFRFFYKSLTYSMISDGSESSLTSFQPFQQFMTTAGAFGLDRSSHFIIFVSYSFDFIGGNIRTIGYGNNIRNAHVNSNEILYVFLLFIRNIYILVNIEFVLDKNEIGFSFRVSHKLWPIASIDYLLPTSYKGYGAYAFFLVIGEDTAVIRYRTKLTEIPFPLSVKFVSVSDLAYSPNDKLGRQLICFFYLVIYLLVQTILLENTTVPRYIGYNVTSLVKDTEGVLKHDGLIVHWKQFNLQSKFHIANIQNIFYIFKYLKRIIKLSLTKEGIVVQFLPEAKDLWVSLNHIL